MARITATSIPSCPTQGRGLSKMLIWPEHDLAPSVPRTEMLASCLEVGTPPFHPHSS